MQIKKIKIVSIGGGEMGRYLPTGEKKPTETTPLDKKIISLTRKKSPRALFIGTAQMDADLGWQAFERQYGKKLGCRVDRLTLWTERPSPRLIKEKILKADLIYVGGGNTLRMLKLWRRLGVDRWLWEAAQKGTVISGLSAGAICWYRWANSDSKKFKDPTAPLCRIRGLDWLPYMICPHYLREKDRKPDLHRMLKKSKQSAFAVDDLAALYFNGQTFEVLRAHSKSNVYWVSYNRKTQKIEEFRLEDYLQSSTCRLPRF